MSLLDLTILLLAFSAAVAVVSRLLRVPYTVALVLAGVALGASHLPGIERLQITPSLVLEVFLPALVFEAGFHLDPVHLRRTWPSIALLAVPGVLFTMAGVAAVLAFGAHLRWGAALAFGAIVAATDPVAVVATFRRLGLPGRLVTLVEGESLFNDGTAIAAFQVLMAVLAAGVTRAWPATVGLGVGRFVVISLGGMALGLASGLLVSVAMLPVREPLVELTSSLVLAYGTYAAADSLGFSGIIATVTAALVLGTFGRERVLTARSQDQIDGLWEAIAFVLNSLLFLLMGVAMDHSSMIRQLPLIGWGIGATIVARIALVYGAAPLLDRLEPLPWRWRHLLVFAGLRGAVAVALVLSLPRSFHDRGVLQDMVFGLVLATLVGLGLGVIPLARASAEEPA